MDTQTLTPPNDIATETAVLGAMILNQRTIPDIQRHVSAEDFYRPAHRTIFKTLCQLVVDGKDIDLVILRVELERQKLFEAVGGIEYLVGLVEGVPDAANAEYYAKIVRDKAVGRQLIQISQDLAREARGQDRPATEILADCEQQLYALHQQGGAGRGGLSAKQAVRAALDRAEAVARGEAPGLLTGFPSLDAATCGFQSGDLIVLGAFTAVGKSSLALNVAVNVAARGQSVLYVSAEMKEREIGHRLLAQLSGIDSNRIRAGMFNPSEGELAGKVEGQVTPWEFFIEGASLTVGEVGTKARELAIKWGHPLNLIIVDYLQLMRAAKRDTRAQEVGAMAWGLKQMAMELGTPILLLSQLSREHAKENRRPALHDLKESGDIENSANTVIFLHRFDPPEIRGDAELINLKIAKARDGRVTPWAKQDKDVPGAIQLLFTGCLTHFEELRPA